MDPRSARKPRKPLEACPICGGIIVLVGGERSPVPYCRACNYAWIPDLVDSVTLWWNDLDKEPYKNG